MSKVVLLRLLMGSIGSAGMLASFWLFAFGASEWVMHMGTFLYAFAALMTVIFPCAGLFILSAAAVSAALQGGK